MPAACAFVQEYARKKYAGNEWFSRNLQNKLESEAGRRERRRGYRATQTAAALQKVTDYGA